MSGHGHSHSCGGCDHDEHFEIATDFELHARITPQGPGSRFKQSNFPNDIFCFPKLKKI
jgi:hypothetical protein